MAEIKTPVNLLADISRRFQVPDDWTTARDPMYEHKPECSSESGHAKARRTAVKIMIVDDSYDNRFILRKTLETRGICIEECDGKQAVGSFVKALHENEPFDLVCMDIMMPEVDGQTALQIIRAVENKWGVPPGQECKVIMISALNSPGEVSKAFFKGCATDYVTKPIDRDRLLAKIDAIMDNSCPGEF
ncbi:MAG: response regulator [Deltaproteobacteria bacterium]|nr:response regulator [Deltaproteobacteria bacterium]